MAKIVKDWTKYLVAEKSIQEDENYKSITTDYVSLPSWEDMKYYSPRELRKSATDFAVLNYIWQSHSHQCETEKGKRTIEYWLKSSPDFYGDRVHIIDAKGSLDSNFSDSYTRGICPTLTLHFPKKISVKDAEKEFGGIEKIKFGGKNYYQIGIGEYPKTFVSNELNIKLNNLFNNGEPSEELKSTGRFYTTNAQCGTSISFSTKLLPEFEYNGEKYVRMKSPMAQMSAIFEDESGTSPSPRWNNTFWVKVEPIKFIIRNSEDFKKGTNDLKLEAEEALLSGLPFFQLTDDNSVAIWQNSLLRAFLNSAKSSELDGNPLLTTEFNWDFSKIGFSYQAFNMTRPPVNVYEIPKSEETIGRGAFAGCIGLDKIIIGPHVKLIEPYAFQDCQNTQFVFKNPNEELGIGRLMFYGVNIKYLYISKDGNEILLSSRRDDTLEKNYYKCSKENFNFNNYEDYVLVDNYFDENYRKNYVQIRNWKESGKVKFIPPSYTLSVFPSSEISNYYLNNNNARWGKLVKTLSFDTLQNELQKSDSLTDLMKIYYAIGGFSTNQGESEKAYNYILKNVAVLKNNTEVDREELADEIHLRFSGLELKGPYNPTFAKFFMKYYHEDPNFMNFGNDIDLLCAAHNSFNSILEKFPNRMVNGNEERSLLTPQFVADHLVSKKYKNVDQDNEELASLIGRYGYSQIQFEYIQNIFNKAKKIKDSFVIQADKAVEKNGISFRILEKDDPLGFVLGDITTCCQKIGAMGEECVKDGYTNANAGFIVFEESKLDTDGNPIGEKRILGQAYIWYDPITKTVCYDNIEIPTKILTELRKGTKHQSNFSTKELLDIVIQSADAIMNAMNKKGIKVDRVTTGKGYNDLVNELKEKFGDPIKTNLPRHREYFGYSDAMTEQFVIRTYDETTKNYSKSILNNAKEIQDKIDNYDKDYEI